MVLVTALLLSLASCVYVAAEEEVVWQYEGDYDGEIEVGVSAPVQADPGDEITVTVEGEAKEDLEGVTMDIWVEGSAEEGAERWKSDEKSVLSYDDLADGDDFDEEFEFEIPETADPGMMLGHITCEWDIWDEDLEDYVTHSFDIAFPMTYLLGAITEAEFEKLQEDYAELQAVYTEAVSERDKWKTDYNSLRSDYDSLIATFEGLNSSYQSLQTDYKSLQADYSQLSSNYDDLETRFSSLESEHKSLLAEYDALESDYEATARELSNYTTYTYALVVATVIFLVTTIIFAVRRPKIVASR